MERDDIKRANVLIDVMDDYQHLATAVNSGDKPRKGYALKGIVISVAHIAQDGFLETEASVVLDLQTGEWLVDHIPDLIRAELNKLGVE